MIQLLKELGIYDFIMLVLLYMIHNTHYIIAVLIALSTLYYNVLKIKNQKLINQQLKKSDHEKNTFTSHPEH